MQCPSCHFENMPNVRTCCQCGTRLDMDSAEVRFHPPRATRLEKWLFPFVKVVYKAWLSLRSAPARLARKIGIPIPHQLPRIHYRRFLLTVLRCFVPGWNQLREPERKVTGIVLISGWGVSILLSVLTIGTPIWAFFCGMVLFFHIASLIDLIFSATSDRTFRLSGMIAMMYLVWIVVYYPVYTAFNHRFNMNLINANMAPFEAGDAVLSRRTNANYLPTRGDVAFFRRSLISFGNNPQYRVEGPTYDRVLALPGQNVKWVKGKLFVDGKASADLPLGRQMPQDLEVTVPGGFYYIVPSLMIVNMPVPDNRVWNDLCLVPTSAIDGRVVWVRRSLFDFPSLQTIAPPAETR